MAFTNTSGVTIYGSLTLVNAMTLSGGTYTFASATAGKTITTAGRTLSQITFNGTGGWTLQDDLTTTSTLTLTLGSLNTNGKNITVPYFQSQSGNTRSLTTGGSKFTLNGSNGDVWYITSTGMTMSAATSDFILSGGGVTFYGGGFTYHDVSFTSTAVNNIFLRDNNTFHNVIFSGKGTSFIVGTNSFNDVSIAGTGYFGSNCSYHDLTLTPGYTYSFNGTTQTLSGTLSAIGTCTSFITFTGAGTISSGSAQTISYVNLQSMKAQGGGVFNALNTIDNGGNIGWTISPLASQNLYWIGGTGNWNDGAHWSLISGGSPLGCIPTSLDNVFFDANSFPSSSSKTVTVNVAGVCNNMDWTGSLNTPVFTNTNGVTIYGSLTLVNAMTLSGGTYTFASATAGKTITTAGRTLSQITFNGTGGWTLQDDLTTTSTLTLTLGSLNTNGKNITVPYFQSQSGNTRSLTTGGSKFTLNGSNGDVWYITSTGMTMSAATSDFILSGGGVTFYGGGFTYHDVSFTSTAVNNIFLRDNNTFHNVIFSGKGTSFIVGTNSFNDVSIAGTGYFGSNCSYHDLTLTPGYTYSFNGTTQTLSGTLSAIGTCTSFITFTGAGTISSGSAQTISYVNLQSMKAQGGGVFNALNTIDNGGNIGWTISPLASQNLYWIGGTGNWNDGAHWSLISGGSPLGPGGNHISMKLGVLSSGWMRHRSSFSIGLRSSTNSAWHRARFELPAGITTPTVCDGTRDLHCNTKSSMPDSNSERASCGPAKSP